MKNLEITLEEILALLPKQLYLYNICYNDNLEDQIPLLQECFKEKSINKLIKVFDESYLDHNAILEVMQNLKENIESKFNIKNSQYLLDKYNEYIQEEVYNRDEIYNVKKFELIRDMLKDTPNIPLEISFWLKEKVFNTL